MTVTRNILLIGRTGNGKSTLANVLIGSENKFKESSKSVSETKGVQVEKFEIDGVNYQVIDTVGIGDTVLSKQQVLYKIAEVSHSIRDGLNQIFFVTNGRFTEAEKEAFDLLGEVIFDENFVKYTTIVRTNFVEFRDKEKCREDREAMKNENNFMKGIIDYCKIIHVNNFPQTSSDPYMKEASKWSRVDSRTKLLTLLGTCQGTYKPRNLDSINERISKYMTEKERLEKELKNITEQMKKLEENHEKSLNEKNKEMKDLNDKLTELENQKENSINNVSNLMTRLNNSLDTIDKLEARIRQLEGGTCRPL